MAVVRGPEILSPTQVGALNDALNRAAGTTVELHVRSSVTARSRVRTTLAQADQNRARKASLRE
jgi:hypothetical protein